MFAFFYQTNIKISWNLGTLLNDLRATTLSFIGYQYSEVNLLVKHLRCTEVCFIQRQEIFEIWCNWTEQNLNCWRRTTKICQDSDLEIEYKVMQCPSSHKWNTKSILRNKTRWKMALTTTNEQPFVKVKVIYNMLCSRNYFQM